MQTFVSILLMVGCGVLCVWSVYKLACAIIDRKKSKKAKASDGLDKGKEENK